jgi:O-antigen/teichoic acid export membrane protein
MYSKWFNYISRFFNSGEERTLTLKKNVLASFFLKLLGISISLVMVPMTIRYVNAETYGIWLTISSITAWLAFFDIGLSNGLRNKFAEAVTKGDTQLARKYVSSTYAILFIIFFTVWVVYIFINKYINWSKILNVDENLSSTLSTAIIIVFTYFCIQSVLKIITTILLADQKPAKSAAIDIVGQLISLLIIFVLTKTTQGSLVYLSISLCLAPLIVLVLSNIILFSKQYKQYRPSFFYINIDCSKTVFNLGIIFFVIQIAGLIQYQSANFIIGRYIGMEDVTSYNITYKYFNVLYMMFSIFLFPFWSAATNAYASGDHLWIKNAIKKYLTIFILFFIAGIFMLAVSSIAYSIWIGDLVHIPFLYSLWCFLYVTTLMFGAIFVNLLNGIGAIKLQYYFCFISPVIFILLCMTFLKLNMGVCSIFIASIISNFNGIIVAPLQYRKIFIEGKGGIWKA